MKKIKYLNKRMDIVCDEKFYNKVKEFCQMKHLKMSKLLRFATLTYISMNMNMLNDPEDREY
jgi:hypothetical protein